MLETNTYMDFAPGFHVAIRVITKLSPLITSEQTPQKQASGQLSPGTSSRFVVGIKGAVSLEPFFLRTSWLQKFTPSLLPSTIPPPSPPQAESWATNQTTKIRQAKRRKR